MAGLLIILCGLGLTSEQKKQPRVVWRKIAKKARRKRIRRAKAALRQQERIRYESTEEYQNWLSQQQQQDDFNYQEEMRLLALENENWIKRECIAQEKWKNQQRKIAKAQLEKHQQTLRIKMEWEERQKKIEKMKEVTRIREEEQLKRHEDFMLRLERFLSQDGDLPNELTNYTETNPDKETCPFFSKTGACRFDNTCSRNHKKPAVSKVLLAKNMFTYYGLEHWMPDECDADRILEFDHNEAHCHFIEFYNDVLPEFQRYGTLRQFKVCLNFAKHLRGNTYIEYKYLKDAVKAFTVFHGRWFGGKQISLEFCSISSWRQAICGLFYNDKCPKGQTCNFLHVFRNPEKHSTKISDSRKNEKRHPKSTDTRRNLIYSKSPKRDWRWSESPDRSTK